MFNALIMAMLVASALLAYAVRRNAVICLAALAFLPFLPAVLRYFLADPTIANPDGDTSVRYMLLGAINFGGVWSGFAAGLLFDRLAGQQAVRASVVADTTAEAGQPADADDQELPDETAEPALGKESATHDAA